MTTEHTNNLENTDFSNWNLRLNSPKSLEACKRAGIEPNQLYLISYDAFLSMNSEIRNLPQEIQLIRYNFYEKTRNDNLRSCVEERENLIEGYKKFEESQFQKSFGMSQMSKSSGSPSFNKKSPSHDTDQKAIEKLKIRQKAEVENLIDQELKLEMLRKENEQKDQLATIKEARNKEALIRKQIMHGENKKNREMMKQYQTEKEFEELQKRLSLKQQEENVKKEFMNENQKKLHHHMMMKKDLQMQKSREKKMNSERLLYEQQRRTIDKQIMMEERANFRKAFEEQKNMGKKMENEKMKEYQQNKINQVKGMIQFKIFNQKQEIERKETLVEQRKKFFEMQNKMSHLPDNPDMYGSLDGNSRTFMPRREDKIKLAKVRNDYERMMKSNSVIQKLDQMDNKIRWKQQQNENTLILKNEINMLKKEEYKNNLQKKGKIQEYYKELNLRKMKEKEERSFEIKKSKQETILYKKSVQDGNNMQKKQVMELFDKLMRNSNSISPEIIAEMFPGEEALIHKLMKLKEVTRSVSPSGRSEENMWNQSKSLNGSFQNSI